MKGATRARRRIDDARPLDIIRINLPDPRPVRDPLHFAFFELHRLRKHVLLVDRVGHGLELIQREDVLAVAPGNVALLLDPLLLLLLS